MTAQPLQGLFTFIQNLWLQLWPVPQPSALEQRVTQLEATVAKLSQAPATAPQTPWWDDITGVFENDPLFDQAMALGADYRRSNEQFVVGYNEAAIQEFQNLRQRYRRLGKMDLKIAAIAISLNATLLTRNLADFGQITELNATDWSQ